MNLQTVPPPTDAAFAPGVTELKPSAIVGRDWVKHGAWRYRQFGNEVQMRNDALPHLGMDIWRSEAEDLYRALAELLEMPAPLPYRVPWHTRLSQWWDRMVWRRKHHQTLERARAVLVDEFIRRGPW